MLPAIRKFGFLAQRIAFSQNNHTAISCTGVNYAKQFSISSIKYCSAKETGESADDTEAGADVAETKKNPLRDRTKVIPVETSIKYMKSSAYQETYGNSLVWEQYRRNHKGLFAPRKTRKTCIRKGELTTGNPCPICRDEYLVLDHRNIDLLNQFISPQSGQVLSYSKTGLCQKRHTELLVAVERAMDYGLLTFDVPFREFDYSEYYGESKRN